MTRGSLDNLRNAQNPNDVEQIDVLWLQGDIVESVFEIEATTSMTEALKRGSNIESGVPKYLVLPQEREDQLVRKLRSPLFGERFQQDSWKCLFFEALDESYQKKKGKVDITTLMAKKVGKVASKKSRNPDQLSLFTSDRSQKGGWEGDS